ncbi:hypothetical protein [Kitasatospora phosalacinea]|uniref:hypothetical protein n=1 Tax=Kitasatospora phosalacinea TaxID=2065 RepID=UPI000526374A|nr:hypothetical protein [Kitasatospora phosalacinea]
MTREGFRHLRKTAFKRATAVLLGAAAIALAAPAAPASADAELPEVIRLDSGAQLTAGHDLRSGDTRLVMQDDGNLVLYLVNDAGQRGPAVWSTGTYNNWGAHLVMQTDGNLVLYRQGGDTQANVLWSTGTWNHTGAWAMFFDGELKLNSSDNHIIWDNRTGVCRTGSTDSGPSRDDVIRAGGRTMTAGMWLKSNSVWLVNQQDGNLVLYRKRDGAALWSSHTANRPPTVLYVSDTSSRGALTTWSTKDGTTVWSTPAKGGPGTYAVVQDDGNFVAYNGSDQAVWSTGTWGNW